MNLTRTPNFDEECNLRISNRSQPVSYVETNADKLAEDLAAGAGALVITQNGVPSFVCVSVEEYCQLQVSMGALIDLVSLGEREIESGNFRRLSEARSILDERLLGTGSTAEPKD